LWQALQVFAREVKEGIKDSPSPAPATFARERAAADVFPVNLL
jgi:hypothetical protein